MNKEIHSTGVEQAKIFAVIFFLIISFTRAGSIEAATLTFVSDTISTSVPGVPSNHTIQFTVTNAVPPSGTVKIVPQDGQFNVPPSLNHFDMDVSIDGVPQALGAFPIGATVGVSVTASTSGSVVLTFPLGVSSGSSVVLKIGTNATFGVNGSQRIKNPLNQGSYLIAIETYNSGGTLLDRASAMVAMVFSVRTTAYSFPAIEKEVIFTPTIATTTILTNTDGTQFKVTTPAGFVSFSDEVQLRITSFHREDIVTTAPPPGGKSLVGRAYELTMARPLDDSTVLSFSQNVTFDLYYSNADVAGTNEGTLNVYKWNGAAWAQVSGSTLFAEENRVSTQVSSFSMYTLLGDTIPPPTTTQLDVSLLGKRKGDINSDGRVNLIDFSIAAYWYKRMGPLPKNVDIDGDGTITLTDFSIMAFYWTG